ncbi:hypothetical protein CTEN210_13404 [Chaetoceros tenuissimus]|uniref:Nuclear pore complex protein Nup85 n=1 Tax=Chaetoceros tenuissimus TaxID=426638 RepID=A0AAD3HBE6_9STRA|nr:hypothetical protein CTEN210_13404 [Chaetoceros tenuissimus]
MSLAFDPKSPSSLIFTTAPASSLHSHQVETGVGCTPEETSTLMKLLSARQFHLENNQLDQTSQVIQSYRIELLECIHEWSSRINEKDENLDLLMLSQAFLHLSQIFLSAGNNKTSDFVRYLRYNANSMDEYVKVLLSEDQLDMESLLSKDQPEYYTPHGDALTGMTPYWALIRKYTLRGCLKDVWSALTHHSALKRCRTGRNYMDPTLEQDNEAFALVQAILLSAPLPGGRDEEGDESIGQKMEEEDMDELLAGIPPNAYLQWDTLDESMNIHAISNLHRQWKHSVQNFITTNIPLRNLLRRIPLLKQCVFDIILNTFESFTQEDTWEERMIAELVYLQPTIPQEDIHIRAQDHMQQSQATEVQTLSVAIMKGNAGIVIQALSEFGGNSMAALPATLTALLCDLLVESGQIELSQLSYDIDTELNVNAASAILASFAKEHHYDVGVKLATQLLSPHVVPENPIITAYVADMLGRHYPTTDAECKALLEICQDAVERGSRRILEACDSLAFARSKHHETTNRYDKVIFNLVLGVEMAAGFGSAGEDTLSYATAYLRTTCYRRITEICCDVSTSILKEIYKTFSASIGELDVVAMTNVCAKGKMIVNGLSHGESSQLFDSDNSVELLKNVVNLGLSLAQSKNEDAAKAIINCLAAKDDDHASKIIPAHSNLYKYLLCSAFDILSAEDTGSSLSEAAASFDVGGMQILFTRFMQLAQKFEQENFDLRVDITATKMREALGKGLMRAFLGENAKIAKKEDSVLESSEPNIELLLGPSL